MRIAVCLLPERELAAELVVFSQTHAARLGGDPLSLATNRPRLELCTGEVDEWSLTPELVAELAPTARLGLRLGAITVQRERVVGPLWSPGRQDARSLVGLQARASVRLGLHLPSVWVPGIPLARAAGERIHPAVRADWAATLEGREVAMARLGILRLDDDGHALATVASHAL